MHALPGAHGDSELHDLRLGIRTPKSFEQLIVDRLGVIEIPALSKLERDLDLLREIGVPELMYFRHRRLVQVVVARLGRAGQLAAVATVDECGLQTEEFSSLHVQEAALAHHAVLELERRPELGTVCVHAAKIRQST